jgi:hypothetical protein
MRMPGPVDLADRASLSPEWTCAEGLGPASGAGVLFVRQPSGEPDGSRQSFETASSTFSAWPSTLTLGKTLRTTPSPSITKVERIIPTVFLP